MAQHPAPVPDWSVIAQVVPGQTAGPVRLGQVMQAGLLLLRLGQGTEQGPRVPLQVMCMAQKKGVRGTVLVTSSPTSLPMLGMVASQPRSQKQPQEQHQEGPSHFHGNCKEARLGFLCLTGLTRSFSSELWTSSGSGKSLSRGLLRNRQCLGPLSHIRGPLGRPVVGIHVQLLFVAVLPIRYLDRKCRFVHRAQIFKRKAFAAILDSVDMERAEVL